LKLALGPIRAADFVNQVAGISVVRAMSTQDVHQTASGAAEQRSRSVHRLLVAFNGSPGSWAALERAIEIAAENRALLTIAAVVQEPHFLWQGPGPMSVPYSRETIRRDLEGEMLRHLANARDEVPATLSVTTQLLHGRAARALAALAEAGCYDLVVTGPRCAGRLDRLLHGSVTHGLLSRGRTSVLAVKTP
jgi:nucleotide-binding universal stress UspA family protein